MSEGQSSQKAGALDESLFNPQIRNNVQFRRDPLTNESARLNPARARRPKQGSDSSSDTDFLEFIKKASGSDPFNYNTIFSKVPEFPADFPLGQFLDNPNASEEEKKKLGNRLQKGESILFPNLSPFGENHSVITVSAEQYVPLGSFDPKHIENVFVVAQAYIQKLAEESKKENGSKNIGNVKASGALYPVLVWNFLPPSAGSLVHPHFQLLVESEPTPALIDFLHASEEYHKKNGQNFWKALNDHETASERFIYKNDYLSIFTTYAPRALNEITFLFPNVSSFDQLTPQHLTAFAQELSRVLKAYQDIGVGSFNLVTYSTKCGSKEASQHFWFFAKLFARPSRNLHIRLRTDGEDV